ncbi:unnamed protein product [Dibothriocephalus latus]|uniref:Adenosine kinase n=1 Tax=Dibothriocephalus latus TaxID=60516 RepID=A0A3P7LHP0_DIBLA|nr:unnamed protein product [Dibothriocephalus latus]
MESSYHGKKYCILGLGHPLLDIQADVNEKFLKKYGVQANGATLSGPGQKGLYEDLLANFDLTYVAGGSAQNTMRMIQWLLQDPKRISCSYLGCVGNDKSGEILLQNMEATGVQTVYEVSDTLPTGVCLVLVSGANRSLVTSLGAAAVFSSEFLREKPAWDMVEEASMYYFMGYFLVSSMDSVMAVMEHAVARRKAVCFNLGAPYVCQCFTERVDKILPYTDFVIGTGDEALAFAEAHHMKHPSLAAVAKFFAGYGWVGRPRHRLVIITQGPDPIFLVSSEDMLVRTIPVDPIPPENTVDTNGAGDAFAAGFISKFITCGSVDEAIEAGKKAAAYILGKSGFSLGPRTEY